MGIKVRGVKQSKAGLNRIINDVKGRKVVRALQSAMIIGSSQAALLSGVDKQRSSADRSSGIHG